VSSDQGRRRIVVLGTGGTIAGTATRQGDNLGYSAAQLGVAQLVHAIAPLSAALKGCTLHTEQVAQVDSKDMGWAVWQSLLQRCADKLADATVQGLVITHGTDTLEETAYLLQAVLQPSKPVVLTCAMRPATALVPDGPQNLLDAVVVATDPGARGVMAVCAGVVHSALDVRKRHPYRLDAFDSGDAGPLGYVEETEVRWVRQLSEPCRSEFVSMLTLTHILKVTRLPRVDIITSHAEADGRVVDLLVQDGVQGLVVAGTGNGTLHRVLATALVQAQARGVRVVRATRCPDGQVLAHREDLFPDSLGLSPVKARLALMLALLNADKFAEA